MSVSNEKRVVGIQHEGHGEYRVAHCDYEYQCPCGKWIGGKNPRGKDEFDVTMVDPDGKEFFICQACYQLSLD